MTIKLPKMFSRPKIQWLSTSQNRIRIAWGHLRELLKENFWENQEKYFPKMSIELREDASLNFSIKFLRQTRKIEYFSKIILQLLKSYIFWQNQKLVENFPKKNNLIIAVNRTIIKRSGANFLNTAKQQK